MTNRFQAITEDEASELAQRFIAFSDVVDDYRIAHDTTLSPEESQRLYEASQSLVISAQEMVTVAVGINLETSQVAVQELGSIIQSAHETLKTIGDVGKALSMVTAVVKLGETLATGNVAGIAGALVALKKSI
jgi:hypothetical protein